MYMIHSLPEANCNEYRLHYTGQNKDIVFKLRENGI